MPDQNHACPICGKSLPESGRYPDYICEGCVAKAVDEAGRPLAFFNVSSTGEFQATYRETGEEAPGEFCYIAGIRCWADEARMGGVVVQPMKS